jgi:NadR type nicotinamide-nucleotide adenylyltransferase
LKEARPLRVVVTGSECTGKTTLASELAAHFGTSWSPEYVRHYLDAKQAPLTLADVDAIARGQMVAEEDAARSASGIVLHDTDLLSTVVYSRHYYGRCPDWVERAARERRAALYLLLRPDVPWVADPQRDRGEERPQMHALFLAALREFRAPFREVGGTWTERRARARDAIQELLQNAKPALK